MSPRRILYKAAVRDEVEWEGIKVWIIGNGCRESQVSTTSELSQLPERENSAQGERHKTSFQPPVEHESGPDQE